MENEIRKVAVAYRIWRKNKPNRGVGAPQELQKRIIELLDKYSWDEVCKTVGVSRSCLSNWRHRHRDGGELVPRDRTAARRKRQARPKAARQTQSFVEVPITAGLGLDAELRLPSGVVIAGHANADVGALGDLFARVIVSMQASEAAG